MECRNTKQHQWSLSAQRTHARASGADKCECEDRSCESKSELKDALKEESSNSMIDFAMHADARWPRLWPWEARWDEGERGAQRMVQSAETVSKQWWQSALQNPHEDPRAHTVEDDVTKVASTSSDIEFLIGQSAASDSKLAAAPGGIQGGSRAIRSDEGVPGGPGADGGIRGDRDPASSAYRQPIGIRGSEGCSQCGAGSESARRC